MLCSATVDTYLRSVSENREDWDQMFMAEDKNWAAIEGLSDKFAAGLK